MSDKQSRILFNSHGRLGVIDLDDAGGSAGVRVWYPNPDVPGMDSWSWGPVFEDRRRIILSSYEPGKAWEGNVRVHLWIYDLEEARLLKEIALKERPAPFMGCTHILPGEDRLVTNPIIDGKQRIWTMDLDGSDPREITGADEGFVYCVQISPDGRRFAYHSTMLEGRDSYCIFVSDLDGGNRLEVAGAQGHLYFGPMWSPDGQWLIYQDCHYPDDPGHDLADLCLGRPDVESPDGPDGSLHRKITTGQRQWFATSYGNPDSRGSGSNIAQWTPDGKRVTYTRAEPGSRTAWPYQAQRPDTDHFNRDYCPEDARGGTAICLLDPFSGEESEFIPYEPMVWNFRSAWSPDGAQFAFCRAEVGSPSSIWLVDADGGNARMLTDGYEHLGADHPVWVG
ncbi:MAG: serine/threonine protein kinase [Gemmatimonadetes bacterium]|nr:serine/threonine protein kinase [Gemmatimonadota bacterium]MYA78322.1 serine/threonine protein kinase [Gemmatimonadota bacterium]MYG17568.1 serine/threonine protein kinase [Gemmatimonadota bacterium]MYH20362.1 serine/threonine protein kinase [Gemmatimonadota bacterium]MYL00066.1 serine/threonine protein kinase [Gemmatimonadota bacterium]